jgi:phospholipid/cholesterol/gamma-HCH transport system permease protein
MSKVVSEPAPAASFDTTTEDGRTLVTFHGDWSLGADTAPGHDVLAPLESQPSSLVLVPGSDFVWDSRFMSIIYRLAGSGQQAGNERQIDLAAMPEGIRTLYGLATAVPAVPERPTTRRRNPLEVFGTAVEGTRDLLAFIGDLTIAMGRLVTGRANTRRIDFFEFLELSGPNAIGIISLVSVLVGMILAYLGAVQLRQFGAQIFVANLVSLGMVREMGALMTAVIMAGRTGAAYAAQLGTMQTREEIDAITTLGVSPMEFLVVPRVLALLVVMPLLVMYSNILGMLGGAIVAMGMDITFIQYVNQTQGSVNFADFATGLFKSMVFALLIAIAGCHAGLACGRSSAAVGQATTKAVVTALVYVIVADAALNILYQRLGI